MLPVIDVECLNASMPPVEVDKTNDIEVLIILLWTHQLNQLPHSGYQAVLLDVLVMVCRVQVTPDLVLRVVLVGVTELRMEPLSKRVSMTAKEESCREAAICGCLWEVSVAESVEIATREV